MARICEAGKHVSIIVCADGGFCHDDIMSCREASSVQYVVGLVDNARL